MAGMIRLLELSAMNLVILMAWRTTITRVIWMPLDLIGQLMSHVMVTSQISVNVAMLDLEMYKNVKENIMLEFYALMNKVCFGK